MFERRKHVTLQLTCAIQITDATVQCLRCRLFPFAADFASDSIDWTCVRAPPDVRVASQLRATVNFSTRLRPAIDRLPIQLCIRFECGGKSFD